MIAVAAVGLMGLSGRIEVRRAAAVVVGAFILFAAPAIAAALHSLAAGGTAQAPVEPAFEPPPAPPPPPPPPPPRPRNPDPYGGASVPGR